MSFSSEKLSWKKKCVPKDSEQRKMHAWLQENHTLSATGDRRKRKEHWLVLRLVLLNWSDIVLATASIPRGAAPEWPVWFSDFSYGSSSRYRERALTQLNRYSKRKKKIDTVRETEWTSIKKGPTLPTKRKIEKRNRGKGRRRAEKGGALPYLT